MDSSSDTENVSGPVGSLSLVNPSVYIFSDAIKQAMGTFAAAHQQSMADMADKNASALAAAVDRISATLSSQGGHTSQEVPPPSLPSTSAHTTLVAENREAYPTAQAHASEVALNSIHFCCANVTGIETRQGAHTAPSVATIAASGNSGCYSSPLSCTEKSRGLPHDDDAVSLIASDTELDSLQASGVLATPSLDPSTAASSLHELNKLHSSEERVGAPFLLLWLIPLM